MTARGARPTDEGSITLFVCVAAVGLLLLAGLVVDGGAKVRAIQRADRLAAEAGRAGGQAIDVRAAIPGNVPVVNPSAAIRAAQAYLTAQGVTGQVRVADAGRALVVDVTVSSPTVFLGLMGVNRVTVHGTSTVRLVRGVTGGGQ
jgi:hypothetical protein